MAVRSRSTKPVPAKTVLRAVAVDSAAADPAANSAEAEVAATIVAVVADTAVAEAAENTAAANSHSQKTSTKNRVLRDWGIRFFFCSPRSRQVLGMRSMIRP